MNDTRIITQKNELLFNINLLVVVVSCKKNSELWPKIINRKIDNFIILCGGSETTKLEDNILYLKCSDEYDGLSEKMLKAFDFIINSEKFSSITHILKADDHDTEYNNIQIKNIVIKYNNILLSHDYIGQQNIPGLLNGKYHFGKVSQTSKWYNKPLTIVKKILFLGGGQTYILSRKSLYFINKHLTEYDNYGSYEDVMMAVILRQYNIYPYTLNYGIKFWPG